MKKRIALRSLFFGSLLLAIASASSNGQGAGHLAGVSRKPTAKDLQIYKPSLFYPTSYIHLLHAPSQFLPNNCHLFLAWLRNTGWRNNVPAALLLSAQYYLTDIIKELFGIVDNAILNSVLHTTNSHRLVIIA